MKVFDRRVKEALLEKKAVINQQEAWEEIAASLDNRSRGKRLIVAIFLLSCLTLAGWTLYNRWESPKDAGKTLTIRQPAGPSSQIKQEVFVQSMPVLQYEGAIPSLKESKVASGIADEIVDRLSEMNLRSRKTQEPNTSDQKLVVLQEIHPLEQAKIQTNMKQQKLPLIATEAEIRKSKTKRSWPSFVFTYGRGIVPSSSSFSDLSLGEFASTSSQPSQQYGLELQFHVSPSWDIRTGFLAHSRRYRVMLKQGGEGTFWQYNYAIPLMLQYHVRGRRLSPYVAFGVHLNLWDENGGTFTQSNTNTGLGYRVNILKGSTWTTVIELGSSFWLLNQKFSIAAEANWGFQQTLDARFGILQNRQLIESYGQATSNGTYAAVKIKYHLDVPLLLASIRDNRRNHPSSSAVLTQTGRKNEVGLEALGAGVYYSVYYQRFLLQKKGFRLGIKPGIAYIPTFEEQGLISGPPDDIKPMGLYVPLSLISYIGKPAFSLQLGLANVFHYGPLRYPIPNGRLYDTALGQFLITGVRGEYRRFSYHGQFNIGVDFEEPNTPVNTAFGFGIGYLF